MTLLGWLAVGAGAWVGVFMLVWVVLLAASRGDRYPLANADELLREAWALYDEGEVERARALEQRAKSVMARELRREAASLERQR